MQSFWDRFGISASILCVVHCLAAPFVAIFLPLVGATMTHHAFHAAIIAVVVPVAVVALWQGYRVHRQTTMFWYAAIGFVFIVLSVLLGSDHDQVEKAFMIAAGLLLSYGHFLNLRARRGCRASTRSEAS